MPFQLFFIVKFALVYFKYCLPNFALRLLLHLFLLWISIHIKLFQSLLKLLFLGNFLFCLLFLFLLIFTTVILLWYLCLLYSVFLLIFFRLRIFISKSLKRECIFFGCYDWLLLLFLLLLFNNLLFFL